MNVVVPFDFSDHAKSAAHFSALLTKHHGGLLHLVHVIVPIEEEPDYLPVKTLNAKRNTVFEIVHFQELLRRRSVTTSCDIVPGEIADQVIKAGRRTQAEMIIMGTQGNSGLRKYLYGSHTAAVIDQSPIPVLTLPEGITFKPFRKMVYATDYNYSNINDVKKIAAFAEKFNSTISLIHINQHSATHSGNTGREDFEELIRNSISYPHIVFNENEHADTAEGLRLFLQKENADLLAISNRRKTLVEKICGRSGENEYTFDLEIPLLVC